MRPAIVCVLTGFVVGCSLDRAGTAADDVPLFETSIADSTIETSIPDTFVEDTFVEEDTTPADSGVDVALDAPDSADVAPDVPATGSLAVTGAPSSFAVNLTAEGKVSWAHWGLLDASSFTRKIGTSIIATGVTPAALRWDGFPIEFAWNDGDPNAVASATRTGIYRTSADPLAFSITGSTASRVLRVYVATDTANATARFALSDSSAAPVTIALPVAGTVPGAGHRPQVLTATFRTATAGARLDVTYTRTTGGGSITLFAATLE